MHRPTRQHRNLLAKLERKTKRSRRSGSKAKRLKKWAEAYKALSADTSSEASEKPA